MGQCGERKVKVVFNFRVLESSWFCQSGPDSAQIGQEGCAQVAERRVANVVSDNEEEQASRDGTATRQRLCGLPLGEGEEAQVYIPALQEDAQVDLKHSLQQTHVCALVETDLMLPDVHNEHLTGGKGEQRALPLKVLVFTSLSAIRALDIHDEDVLGHPSLGSLVDISLILAHPDTLGRLSPLILRHDAKAGAKQRIQKCTLSCRLRSKHRDDVVVETLAQDVFLLKIGWEARVEVLVLVDDLNAMFKAL